MKPKLLAIGHSYVVALNRALMREIHQRGKLDVTVVAPKFVRGELRGIPCEAEPPGSTMNVRKIQVHLSGKIHFLFYSPGSLRKLIDEEKPDWVYLWEEPYIASGFQLARELVRAKIPYSIFTAQNLVKNYPWPFRLFEAFSLQRSQEIWPCGVQVQSALAAKGYGQHRQKLTPLFVDIKRFRPAAASEKQLGRARLGLPEGPVLGFLGRLTEEKGVRVFLKTAEAMLQRTSANVLIVGSGPLSFEVNEWAKSLSMPDRIKVLSATHEEVARLLPLMDVLLCPSQPTPAWEEQFGRMLIEAFAAGVAVIGSRSGEIPHVIGEAGLIVEPQDSEGWRAQTERLLIDENFRRSLIEKGTIRARAFAAETIAAQVEQNVLDGLQHIK